MIGLARLILIEQIDDAKGHVLEKHQILLSWAHKKGQVLDAALGRLLQETPFRGDYFVFNYSKVMCVK